MSDITQLIDKIVSDPKIANNSNFGDKIYRDEPILVPAQQMLKFTPPKIREMRRIARGSGYDAKTFYEQAVFMESFEDDFAYQGEFVQYFPTYQHMTDAQLRGYFAWRAKVRAGVVEKTSLSFAFVYIYELLNQVGVPTLLDGFYTLKNFWSAYRDFDSRINSYVELWLKDYVVYNNLDRSLLEDFPDAAFDKSLTVLLNHEAYGAEDVFAALTSISAYKLENSRFYKQHPDDVKDVVRRVFSVISEYHNRNPQKTNACDKFFGRVVASSYTMFKTAVFYDRAPRRDMVYEIGNCHKYICRNGSWACERFLWYGSNNKRIGALLKTIDFLMRREYGLASTLQSGKTNKVLTAKIEKEIVKYREDKLKSAPREITIDTSILQHIRHTALATQNKLLVEELEDVDLPEVADEETAAENATSLNETEYQFMHALLYGQPYDSLVQSKGVLLSVLVDGINEKQFDMFSDTVIADVDGRPVLIEDYIEDLKGIVKK